MRKGEKIKEILTVLAAGTLTALEVIDELSPVGFTRSYYKNKYRGNSLLDQPDAEAKKRKEFYDLLSYLKCEGFIEKKKAENTWKITFSGLKKLKILKERSINYQAETDNKLKIIVFDVPEKERKLRAWLRGALKVLGFKMLQQSVWIGKGKIPEQFLFDLRQKNLLPYIHIMEASKGDTIKELT